MRDAEDDALIGRARNGEADAFALLYSRYKLDVWNLAYFQLRDHHEAEDSVQETFLKAYRGLGRFQRRDSLRPWLLTICRNVCLDRLRARALRTALSLDDTRVPERAHPVEDHDQRIDFRRALADLPIDDCEAFFLVDVLGVRSDEAARIVGARAASTVRSRVARARQHLAPSLADPETPARAAPTPEVLGA